MPPLWRTVPHCTLPMGASAPHRSSAALQMTGRVASVNPKPCGAIDTGKGGYIWKWQATGNGQLTVTTCGYMSSGVSAVLLLLLLLAVYRCKSCPDDLMSSLRRTC